MIPDDKEPVDKENREEAAGREQAQPVRGEGEGTIVRLPFKLHSIIGGSALLHSDGSITIEKYKIDGEGSYRRFKWISRHRRRALANKPWIATLRDGSGIIRDAIREEGEEPVREADAGQQHGQGGDGDND